MDEQSRLSGPTQRTEHSEWKSDSICNLGHPGIVGKDTLATGAISWDYDSVSRSGLATRVAGPLVSHRRCLETNPIPS